MRKKKSHVFCLHIQKLIAVMLALVLTVSALPARAASNEIVVKTKKQLVKAMESKSAATIIFRTNRKTRFIIPEIANSANKKLIMEAPNARAFNKATFKTVTLNKSEYFNERGTDNLLYIKGDGIKLTVSKGIEAKKVSINATDVIVKVASNGNVDDIVIKKMEADITVAVAKNAEANITVKKKADLSVNGDKTADITIVSKAAGTKITATAPIDIVAEKDADVVLEKGSEGSTVDSSKDADVGISGAAEKEATVTKNKETVQEPEGAAEEKEDGKQEEEKQEEEKQEEEKQEEDKQEAKAEENKEENGSQTQTDTQSSTGSYIPSTYPYPSQPAVTQPVVTDENAGKKTITFPNEVTGGTVAVTQGGSSLSSGAKVDPGSTITITLTPGTGYAANSVTISNNAGTLTGSGNSWTVTNITGDFTISVSFYRVRLEAYVSNSCTGNLVSGTAIGGDIVIDLSAGNVTVAAITIASGSAISSLGSADITVNAYSGNPPTELNLCYVGVVYNTQSIVDIIISVFNQITKVYYLGNVNLSHSGVSFVSSSVAVDPR